jgi:hypothetical protein
VKDAVVWVVGLSSYRFPTLEARIHVDEIYFRTSKGKRWKGVAGLQPQSRFFGLNDATEAMACISFTNQRGKAWRLDSTDPGRPWNSQHGRRLQNPLRLASEGDRVVGMAVSTGASPLVDLATSAENHSVFISYKHADVGEWGSEAFLDQLAAELARMGLAVWLDRVALKGTGGKELQPETDTTMAELLRQGLNQSRVVLGVWSDRYGTPSILDGKNWTMDEWHGGQEGTKRIALDFGSSPGKIEGLRNPHARVRMPESAEPSSAKEVGAEIAAVCRRYWNEG